MIDSHPHLQSSCRVALAVFMQSLDKFAERVHIPEGSDKGTTQSIFYPFRMA